MSFDQDLSNVSRIVRRTIYAHLHQLCDLFDGDGAVANHVKIYDLLSELLRTPSIAKDFCNREGNQIKHFNLNDSYKNELYNSDGVRSLYNSALENFPVELNPLAMIADAIASTGANQQHFVKQISL